LRLSNLDKPFWPEEGITKGELLAYYRDVAAVLVPHLRKRPFTMKRYPDGWQGKSFFQKQAPSHIPDWIETAAFPASTREGEKKVIDYALVDDELALLWMVNMGCIDMHTWASRVDRPERPDWVMFDLDPAEGSTFEDVVEVALLVRETLDVLGLESVPKTSGSRGIHVLVPIARRHGFDEGARVRRHRRGRPGPRAPGSRHDRVGQGEAPRRARRREPERPGEDHRVRLLGAPEGGSARLDAAPLGRGRARPRPPLLHDGRRLWSASGATVISSLVSSRAASRSAPRSARSLSLTGRPRRTAAGTARRRRSRRRRGGTHSAASRTRSWCATGSPRGSLHVRSDLPVAEPSRHARGLGGAPVEPPGTRRACPEAAERELEHRDPHLRSEPAALARGAEPRPGVDDTVDRERVGTERLRADRRTVVEGEQVQPPLLRAPRCEQLLVVRHEVCDEPRFVARVGPRDGERHLVRRVDARLRDIGERLQLGPAAEASSSRGVRSRSP
jgi:DNA ligase D-like protein (predicted polymerase)